MIKEQSLMLLLVSHAPILIFISRVLTADPWLTFMILLLLFLSGAFLDYLSCFHASQDFIISTA